MNESSEGNFYWRKYFGNDEGKKFKASLLGDDLLGMYCIKSVGEEKKTIFVYQNGVYKNTGKNILSEEITNTIKPFFHQNHVNEVLSYITNLTTIDLREIKDKKNLINLKNGLFDLDNYTIQPHDPNFFNIVQLPIDYDSEASCPNFLKFVAEVVGEELVPLVQEIFGYCLYRSYPIKKAFLFYGEPDSGKTTLLNVLVTFLGKENCSAVPLQKLSADRFAGSDLFGKAANICGDLPKNTVKDTSVFKMLVGQDVMRSEKKFKDAFDFFNSAKLIFSANILPKPEEDEEAYYVRWILVPCRNKFVVGVNAVDRDELIKQLTTEKELSGIFLWSIEGLNRLLENKRFLDRRTEEDIEDEYREEAEKGERDNSSVIALFVREKLETDLKARIPVEELYNKYKQVCKDHGEVPDHPRWFTRKLAKYIKFGQRKYTTKGDESRIMFYTGIKFKEGWK